MSIIFVASAIVEAFFYSAAVSVGLMLLIVPGSVVSGWTSMTAAGTSRMRKIGAAISSERQKKSL